MALSNQTGRAARPLRARSIAMSARRRRSGILAVDAAAEAMPAKAPTWMIFSSNSNGRVTIRSTASASSSARPIAPPASDKATANSSPLSRASTASGTEFVGKRDGKRFQQAVAGLIPVLVVDCFEPVHLDGNDDQVITPRCGFGT